MIYSYLLELATRKIRIGRMQNLLTIGDQAFIRVIPTDLFVQKDRTLAEKPSKFPLAVRDRVREHPADLAIVEYPTPHCDRC